MKSIDIIIPLHLYNQTTIPLLTRCLMSIKSMASNSKKENIKINLNIVGPNLQNKSEEIFNLIEWGEEFNSFNIIDNEGEIDFCSQVNFAVKEACKSEYFMVVEFDDIVTEKWLNMSIPYILKYKKCPIFLPLVEVYDINNPQKPLHYINEIGWSSTFTENELGFLNNEALLDYCNFNITGSIIKRIDFIKAGGFKPSIKLSFGYELLLRLSHLYKNIYIIPKVGYFHFINREGSLTSEYHKTITQKEGSWWIKLATEEYTYKNDRNKIYTEETEK